MPDALFTDLYELTMMAGYRQAGIGDHRAVFDLFFRHRPKGVGMMVAAGQELVLTHLEELAFGEDDLAYLRAEGTLPAPFVDELAGLEFTGDVWAVPEGTPVFADEPVLRVEAPLVQAQLIETALLNAVCFSSLVASNAVEVVAAAGGRRVLEFGARRAHGPDGALSASRAAYIGGCHATSNVAAGAAFDIPIAGTQAHAWVMAFESELESFRAYARSFPSACVLLVDTYDTLEVGVPNAITVAHEMAAAGHRLRGIRLDSGDLDTLSRGARKHLDAAGLEEVRIIASGDLDADRVRTLVEGGAPIDGFGVGTSLVTAKHDPTVAGVYKLAELAGEPLLKISSSPAKTTSPGRKQIWRTPGGDVIGLEGEAQPGRPLLEPLMREGRRLDAPLPARELRDRCAAAVADVRPTVERGEWSVRRSDRLDELRQRLVTGSRAGRG